MRYSIIAAKQNDWHFSWLHADLKLNRKKKPIACLPRDMFINLRISSSHDTFFALDCGAIAFAFEKIPKDRVLLLNSP